MSRKMPTRGVSLYDKPQTEQASNPQNTTANNPQFIKLPPRGVSLHDETPPPTPSNPLFVNQPQFGKVNTLNLLPKLQAVQSKPLISNPALPTEPIHVGEILPYKKNVGDYINDVGKTVKSFMVGAAQPATQQLNRLTDEITRFGVTDTANRLKNSTNPQDQLQYESLQRSTGVGLSNKELTQKKQASDYAALTNTTGLAYTPKNPELPKNISSAFEQGKGLGDLVEMGIIGFATKGTLKGGEMGIVAALNSWANYDTPTETLKQFAIGTAFGAGMSGTGAIAGKVLSKYGGNLGKGLISNVAKDIIHNSSAMLGGTLAQDITQRSLGYAGLKPSDYGVNVIFGNVLGSGLKAITRGYAIPTETKTTLNNMADTMPLYDIAYAQAKAKGTNVSLKTKTLDTFINNAKRDSATLNSLNIPYQNKDFIKVQKGLNDIIKLAEQEKANTKPSNTPEMQPNIKNPLHIDERTLENTSKPSIKAFQYEHPQVKPFYQDIALELHGDIGITGKGGRTPMFDSSSNGATQGRVLKYEGQKLMTSEALLEIKNNTGASYDDISKALDNIIHDKGQENYALAKKIELTIDDMLTNGYRQIDGIEISPNEVYREIKTKIDGAKPENYKSDNPHGLNEGETLPFETDRPNPLIQAKQDLGIETSKIDVQAPKIAKADNIGAEIPKGNTTLYHGSPTDNINELADGTWLSPNKEFAQKFADGKAKEKPKSAKAKATVYSKSVDLSKENILDISKYGMDEYVIPDKFLKELGFTQGEINSTFQNAFFVENNGMNKDFALRYLVGTNEFKDIAANKGYTVIKAKEGLNSPTDYVDTYKLLKSDNINVDTVKGNEQSTVPPQFNREIPESVLSNEKGAVDLPPIQNKGNKYSFADPELEKIHQTNMGVAKDTAWGKVKDWAVMVKNQATRTFERLPNKPEFARTKQDLVLIKKNKTIAGNSTKLAIDNITKNLTKDEYDLFGRKVFLDSLAEDVKLGEALPNKWTPTTVASELKRLDEVTPQNVKDAIGIRNTHYENAIKENIAAMKNIGIDLSETYTRKNYFRHQVLDEINSKNAIKGSEKVAPNKRGFQKARSGEYEGNINTDYLQTEYEVLAQMEYDTLNAKTLYSIKQDQNIAAKVKLDAKTKGLENWHDAIPDGYVTWQPQEGNVFYRANTLTQKIVTEMQAGVLKELGIDDIGSALAMGSKKNEWVVKKEVADTLDTFLVKQKQGNILNFVKNSLSVWKGWVLTGNPLTVVKYNFRNLTGDAEKVATNNPSAFMKTPQASKELINAMMYNNFTPDMKKFYDMGYMQSLTYAQEIGDVNFLKPFARLKDKQIIDLIRKPTKGYLDTTRGATDFREATLRYANFLDYKEQILKNGGRPSNFGASKPELVMALKDPDRMAGELSNRLLGAYDEISVLGTKIREKIYPFWSWKEVNFTSQLQSLKNAFNNDKTATVVGNTMAKKMGVAGKVTAVTALKIGRFALKVSGITVPAMLFNNLVWGDIEKNLPEDVKKRPHFVFGKGKDDIYYFPRIGAVSDFWENFGMGSITQDVIDVVQGKRTLQEQIVYMAKQPLNAVVGGLSPLIKAPYELISKKALYPDIMEQGTIKDTGEYLAQTVGLKSVYNAITGRPSKSLGENVKDAFVYRIDPKESSYYNIVGKKYDFLKKLTGTKPSFSTDDPKYKALYNYKKAVQLNDEAAQKKYLELYKKYDGTKEGMQTSVESMNPLRGLTKKVNGVYILTADGYKFVKGLSTDEKKQLDLAKEYYKNVISATNNKQGVNIPTKKVVDYMKKSK